MIKAEPTITLPRPQQQALQRAIKNLENPDFAARLADYAGRPISRAMQLMPKPAADRFNRVVEAAILRSLNIAIRSIEPRSKRPPAQRASSLLAGISGGVSGFFGVAALPIELPVTTTLMLRAIADIARHHGEDLSTLEARLACVEVFALGASGGTRRTDRRLLRVTCADQSYRRRCNRYLSRAGCCESVRAGRQQPRYRDRRALWYRCQRAIRGERAAGSRRGRRRYGKRHIHESLSTRGPRTFRHPAA